MCILTWTPALRRTPAHKCVCISMYVYLFSQITLKHTHTEIYIHAYINRCMGSFLRSLLYLSDPRLWRWFSCILLRASEPQSEPLGEAGTRWPEVPGVPCRRCAAALWIWAQGPGCSMLQLQSDVSHPVSSCLLLSLGGFLWQMVEPATLPAFFFWSVSKAGDDWDGFWGFLGDILPATWLCEKIGCSEITVDYHCFPHQMVNCQDMFFLMLSLPDLVGFLRATPRGLTQVWHRHCDPHRCERDLSGHRVSWRSGLGPWDFARWNLEKSEDYGRFVRASDSKCPKNSIVSGYLNYDLWIFMKNYTDFYGFVLNLGDTAMKVVIFSLVHMMINHGIFGGALFSDKPNWGK